MTYPVAITPLEKDDRVQELQRLFPEKLAEESAFSKLSEEQKTELNALLMQLNAMRFDNADKFIEIATALIKNVAPTLAPYIAIAIDKAKESLDKKQGVLIVYTGGTIGSAPKDPSDPDSPQIVKPWGELKAGTPKLGNLGYPVDAISFKEPLDSCNVGPEHWQTMAGIIRDRYNDYSGFVILHGTDSMAYTSSALALLLQDLSKPVVITGSQLAGIVNPRNDAHQNIITAVMLANPIFHNLPLIPEVVASFGGRITRGCRTKKVNVTSFQGFDSPNYPVLGVAGDVIHIDTKHVRPASAMGLTVLESMDTHVIMLEAFPGMQNTDIIKNVLADESLKGVVLQAYGAGNIPTKPAFLDQFKAFIERGGIVVITTMVPAGRVEMGLYETSQVLLDRGLIGAFDITPEAALCKLMILLGGYPDDPEQIKHLMQQSIVGEQSLSLETSPFDQPGSLKSGEKMDIKTPSLHSCDNEEHIHRVILRFVDAKLKTAGEDDKAAISIILNGMQLGPFNRLATGMDALGVGAGSGESLAIDLTHHKALFVGKTSSSKLGGKQPIQLQIGIDGAGSSFSWSKAELNIYVGDE